MIICVAKNYQAFEKWRDERVLYVGDARQLAKIDPTDVREILFVGEDFRDHPLYFSDALLEFQMNVALAKRGDGERARVTPSKPSPIRNLIIDGLSKLMTNLDTLGKAIQK